MMNPKTPKLASGGLCLLLFMGACAPKPPPAPVMPPPPAVAAPAPTPKPPRTYCQADDAGVISRADEFKKLSCPAWRKAVADAIGKEGATPLLWFCWVMDPCARK